MAGPIIVWTALPNGIIGPPGDRRLRLSVFIAPHLDPDQDSTLSQFADFTEWPAHVKADAVRFTVHVAGVPPVDARIVSGAPRADLWTALFAPTSIVKARPRDNLTARPVGSYSVDRIHERLRSGYQQVGSGSPVLFPRQAEIDSAFPLRAAMRRPASGRRSRSGLTPRELNVLLAEEFFADDGRDVTSKVEDAITNAQRIAAADPTGFVEIIPSLRSVESDFAQLLVFHQRAGDAAPAAPPRMDFHEALTAVGAYPSLLRELGLVIDLEVPAAGFPQSPRAQSPARTLKVEPTFRSPLTSRPVSPLSAYILEGDRFFLPASRPAAAPGESPETEFGMVRLHAPARFRLVQFDLDGVALKQIGMLAGEPIGADPPDAGGVASSGGVPSMRTSGVWIARADQGRTLHGRIQQGLTQLAAVQSESAPPVTLFADDLRRGIRVDVRSSRTRRWQSLHQRRGRYVFTRHSGGPHTLTVDDEGFAEPAVTQSVPTPGATAPSDQLLYAHESLAHWQGWSLAAPRPGKTLTPQGPAVVVNTAPPDGFPLDVSFTAADRTLPTLRLGVGYQFRARVVDLAGNSLTLGEADELLDSSLPNMLQDPPVLPAALDDPAGTPGAPVNFDAFAYRRFEPVVSPVLVARERFGPGESLECLVIRSNRDRTATDYARELALASGEPYRGTNDRHVAPPKTSLWMAEAHGLLDAAFGAVPGETPEQFNARCHQAFLIARKEKGQLRDPDIFDTATGQLVPIPPTPVADPVSGATIMKPSVELVVINAQAPANKDHTYALHREPQLALPYLPDPLSRGAAFFGLPGLPRGRSAQVPAGGQQMIVDDSFLPDAVIDALGSTTHVSFAASDAWPHLRPFRLEIVESSGQELKWDAAARVLTVPLAKGEQATVRFSSFLDEGDLNLLAMWRWLNEFNAEHGVPTPTAQTARAGACWILTPFRELRLVHAVQQPLVDPQFILLRQRLSDGLSELIEEVTAAIAAGGDPGISLPLPPEVLAADRGRTHALLMGEIRVSGNSTSRIDLHARWNEPADIAPDQWAEMRARVAELPIDLPGARPPERELAATLLPLAPGVRYIPGPDKVQFSFVRHHFGDTRHRLVRYRSVATTRFREYLPPRIADDPAQLTAQGPEQELHILSTERPAPPRIRYVIPTFAWESSQQDSARISRRRGGGLRVYLDRPWFSSGADEKLAVIIGADRDPPPDPLFEATHQRHSTEWGRDPIWASGATFSTPSPEHFAGGMVHSGLSLDEVLQVMSTSRATVVAYDVSFDKERQLWFADIEIDAGPAYCPFVRLALARYQPHSIADAHLSRVVRTDFVQLFPDRSVSVQPEAGDPDTFLVTVEGRTYDSNVWRPRSFLTFQFGFGFVDVTKPDPPKLVRVSVHERIPGTTDDAGWRPAAGTAVNFLKGVTIDLMPAPPDTLLWQGRVTLPRGRAPGQFRIVIQEFEHFLTAERDRFEVIHNPDDTDLPPGVGTPSHEETFYPGAGRLVFADTIEL